MATPPKAAKTPPDEITVKMKLDKTGPVAVEVPLPDPDAKALTPEEVQALKGDLEPGEIGWVKLDDEGKPSGPAMKEPPKAGDGGAYAKVVAASLIKPAEVTTPAGAPITNQMNPDPQLWDEGMLARNPVPGSPKASAVPPPDGPYLGKPGPIGHQMATPPSSKK